MPIAAVASASKDPKPSVTRPAAAERRPEAGPSGEVKVPTTRDRLVEAFRAERGAPGGQSPPPTTRDRLALQFLASATGTRDQAAAGEAMQASPAMSGAAPGTSAAAAAPSPPGGGGPPEPPDSRDTAEKARQLEAAREAAEAVIDGAASIGQVEQAFPSLRRRFGLAEIGFQGLGTPGATLHLRVNPAAQITKNLNRLELNAGDTSHATALKQDVSFQTAQLKSGDTVGTHMTATRLGPNHPQGGAPKGSALSGVMSLLPTDPQLPGTDKYIKGHLLNDNLGGPGLDENLFPITGQANKEHEQHVESVVKTWVNTQGFWVYYEVSITHDDHTDENPAYVNSVIDATAQKLDASGRRTSAGLRRLIPSVLSQRGAVTSGQFLPESLSGSAAKDLSFDPTKVEVSSAKGEETPYLEVDPAVRVAMVEVNGRFDQLLTTPADRESSLKQFLEANDYVVKILVDPSFDESLLLGEDQHRKALWNTLVGQINEGQKNGLEGALANFVKTLDATIDEAKQGALDTRDTKKLVRSKAATMSKFKLKGVTKPQNMRGGKKRKMATKVANKVASTLKTT